MRDYVHFVLVSGGRDHPNASIVWNALDAILFLMGDVGIITGSCPTGVDMYAEQWAKRRQQIYMGFPAEWDKYGRRAGMRRNEEMIAVARPNQAAIFQGGRGTMNMLSVCQQWKRDGELQILWFPEGEFWE